MDVEGQIDAKRYTVIESPKVKAPLRMRYEAELKVIRMRVGGLEEIRAKLGLSRRKMCQLLLVDPSAWTRWTTKGGDAPPHIYRALEWYLLLSERDPRALMPIGSWSSTAFEDRFQLLETGLQQVSKARAGVMALLLILGAIAGAIGMLVWR